MSRFGGDDEYQVVHFTQDGGVLLVERWSLHTWPGSDAVSIELQREGRPVTFVRQSVATEAAERILNQAR